MRRITLGKTGISVNANGFGALPIQRISKEEAVRLLRKAFDGGFDYFDTARYYTDSEEKIGLALADVRDKIIISTKTAAKTADAFWKDLHTSLTLLKTGHIDIYQFHNPNFVPQYGDGAGLMEAMAEAKQQGKIRFIGITNHGLPRAKEAIESGLYDTLQFPLSYLSTDAELELSSLCKQANMGLIAMKALSGGLITDSAIACAFLAQYGNIVPIWGIQREKELDEFLSYNVKTPEFTEEMRVRIAQDRQELSGEFCRGCGYCMPCPAGIEINNCARMSLLLRRAPQSVHLNAEWQAKMMKVKECRHCGRCKSKCPYHLDTPELLRKNLEDYLTFL